MRIRPAVTLVAVILAVSAPAFAATNASAVARGLRVSAALPVEVHTTAGGAVAGPGAPRDEIRVADQRTETVQVAGIVDSAQASAGHAESWSRVANVVALNGLIRADVVRARATATAGAVSDQGSAAVGLIIAGMPVDASIPNTRVDLPDGGYVVVHETIERTAGTGRELTVNMLHVFGVARPGKFEIVIGSAYAGFDGSGGSLSGPAGNAIERADDAGSGRDAGDDVAGAVPLSAGVAAGGFGPGDVRDVYSFVAGQGDRIVALVTPVRRFDVYQNPIPAGPPAATPANAISYATAAAAGTRIDGPDRVRLDVALRDPAGALRLPPLNLTDGVVARPDKVELNADLPADGSKSTWHLIVERTGELIGGYTITFELLPVVLSQQQDGGAVGDAPDACVAARPLAEAPTQPAGAGVTAHRGVIRGTDPADFFQFAIRPGDQAVVSLVFDGGVDGADFDLYLYGPASGGAPSCANLAASSVGGKFSPRAIPEAVMADDGAGIYVIEVRRFDAVADYTILIETH